MARSMADDLPEKQWGRAYRRDLLVVLLAYALLLGLSNFGLSRVDSDWRYAIALLPMAAVAGLPLVTSRMQGRVDERLREQMRTAVVHAFFGTAMVTFGYGFLEEAGAPRQSMFWVWGLMGALTAGSMAVQRHRDR